MASGLLISLLPLLHTVIRFHADLLLQAFSCLRGSSEIASLSSATEGVAHAGQEQHAWVTFYCELLTLLRTAGIRFLFFKATVCSLSGLVHGLHSLQALSHAALF